MTMAELPDPSPHISEMSQGQLRALVEELVRTHNRNGDSLTLGVKDDRPSWWPPDVAWINPHIRTRRHSQQQEWSDGLRKVVRSCYKHHGQEHRLQESNKPADDENVIGITDSNTVPCITKDTSQQGAKMPALESRLPEPVPTSGPIPAKAMSSWKKEDFPNLAALPEAEAATINMIQRDDEAFVEIFICFYCEKEFDGRNQLQDHQAKCTKSSKPRATARKGRKGVSRPIYKCKETHPDNYKRPERRALVEAVGLIPQSKLATFQKRKNKEEIKFDDIELDEHPIPKTPTTPRSAKSLISQLSRDLSPPPSTAKLKRLFEGDDVGGGQAEEGSNKNEESKDTDNESECSSKSDTVESAFTMRKIPSLLAIDLCSLLGQRVKKLVDKLDSSDRTSYEDFCHTPVKNSALDRLRNRPSSFPVTFRKNKRLCPPQCHWYKFTKRDKREFQRILATGLNKRARLLKQELLPCRVRLERLKPSDIIAWSTPRKHPRMIKQITSVHPGQHTWHFVTQQDGQRVLVRNTHAQNPRMLLPQHGQGQNNNQLMRIGHHQGMPLKNLNSQNALSQHNRYKAVLSNVSGLPQHFLPQVGLQPLNVYQLPLSCPSNNRNFGKTLQPTGLYGPNPTRAQAFGSHNRPRPNILSKENGAMHRNKTVRRLSMEGGAKTGNLTSEYLQQLPSSVPRKKPEDDVISISSTESESEPVANSGTNKRPLPEDRNNNNSANKRPKLSPGGGGTQVVLFRCHLCQAEITCKLGQTDFIKKHFAERHAVNNIHLLEHLDSNNQKVVTIVEDNGPKAMSKVNPGPPGRNQPRLSNGLETPKRNVPFSGRMGPNSTQDRSVLKDSSLNSPGQKHSRVNHPGQVENFYRKSDGKPHRTNVAGNVPEEIIILD